MGRDTDVLAMCECGPRERKSLPILYPAVATGMVEVPSLKWSYMLWKGKGSVLPPCLTTPVPSHKSNTPRGWPRVKFQLLRRLLPWSNYPPRALGAQSGREALPYLPAGWGGSRAYLKSQTQPSPLQLLFPTLTSGHFSTLTGNIITGERGFDSNLAEIIYFPCSGLHLNTSPSTARLIELAPQTLSYAIFFSFKKY